MVSIHAYLISMILIRSLKIMTDNNNNDEKRQHKKPHQTLILMPELNEENSLLHTLSMLSVYLSVLRSINVRHSADERIYSSILYKHVYRISFGTQKAVQIFIQHFKMKYKHTQRREKVKEMVVMVAVVWPC